MIDENKTGAEIEADLVLADLAAQLERATPAPEPGSQRPGQVIAKTLEDENGEALPIPMMVATRQESAGYTWVYDRQTGERVPVNNNMLRMQLRKERVTHDGRREKVFSTTPPAVTPVRGTIKCYLHPEHEGRAEWADYGFTSCYKANLISQYALQRHMQTRHPQEWATINERRERLEKEEEKAHRRAIIELAARNVAAPAPAKKGAA